MVDFLKKCMATKLTEEACLQMMNKPVDDMSQLIKRAAKFSSWGGKRDETFDGGKRAAKFSSWGGKRGPPPFSSWSGKRDEAFGGGKRREIKGPGFSSWGGKRSPAFNSWGGKRSDDLNTFSNPNDLFENNEKLNNEEKRKQDDWSTNRGVNIQGKKEMIRKMKAFSSWGGKRIPKIDFNELKPLYFSRCGYSWPSRWSGKRTVGFSSWGGKRSNLYNLNENEKDRIKREFTNEENTSPIQIIPIVNGTILSEDKVESTFQNMDHVEKDNKNVKENEENLNLDSEQSTNFEDRTKKWMVRPLRWVQNWYEWNGKRASGVLDDGTSKDMRFSAWGGKRRDKAQGGEEGNEKNKQLRTSRFYAWGGKRSKV